MAFDPTQWQAGNSALNASYNDVQKLERQLAALGVSVTAVNVLPQGIGTAMSGAVTTAAKDILAAGAQATDKLFFVFTISDSQSTFDAAQTITDLAPLTVQAVQKVMADLYGGTGIDVNARSNQALVGLPAVQAVISSALASI